MHRVPALLISACLALAACTGGPDAAPAPARTTPAPALAPAPALPATPTPMATGAPTPAPPPRSEPAPELLVAAAAGDVEGVRRALAAGADLQQRDASEQTAFLIATSEVGDDPRLLDLLLASGADVRDKDSFNGTGLIRAAERGFPRIVARLLDAGIEVDHVNRLGWTALHEAIILGTGSDRYVRTVRHLVDAGADVMLPSQNDGVRPIEHAERRGFTRIAALLREAAQGMTPNRRLLQAAHRGSVAAAEAALADGAEIEARDARGRTPLLRAVAVDRVAVARLLVDRGADVNAVDDQSDTPFLVTGVTGSVPMLEALLPGRPDTRLTNRFGGVAVIPAAERGHVDYVRAVLAATDIDVNHVNRLGWTALLEAVILGDGGLRHQRIVDILLDSGADRTIADNDGVTALEHADRMGFDEIAARLRR